MAVSLPCKQVQRDGRNNRLVSSLLGAIMALRRAGQSLAGRLLQGQVPAFGVAGVQTGPLLPQQEDDQSTSSVYANSMPSRGASEISAAR